MENLQNITANLVPAFQAACQHLDHLADSAKHTTIVELSRTDHRNPVILRKRLANLQRFDMLFYSLLLSPREL
jgi:hypothetical protein